MSYEEKLSAARTLLQTIARDHAPAVCASSLGAEDMVLMDLIVQWAPSIGIFTLDTGRLHPETHELIARAEQHFHRRVRVYVPDQGAVETYVRLNGINGFYDSIAQRKSCCQVRKVEPLQRALAGCRAWLTGMRREQSATRAGLPVSEYDAEHGVAKFNPLAEWSLEDVWHHVRTRGLPYNALHDRGFPSIGCAPCTRPVLPGEDLRAGRWWWESSEHKECGLHPSQRGQSAATDRQDESVAKDLRGLTTTP
jgi:phosphoadenosine phosphosulfate reductase